MTTTKWVQYLANHCCLDKTWTLKCSCFNIKQSEAAQPIHFSRRIWLIISGICEGEKMGKIQMVECISCFISSYIQQYSLFFSFIFCFLFSSLILCDTCFTVVSVSSCNLITLLCDVLRENRHHDLNRPCRKRTMASKKKRNNNQNAWEKKAIRNLNKC